MHGRFMALWYGLRSTLCDIAGECRPEDLEVIMGRSVAYWQRRAEQYDTEDRRKRAATAERERVASEPPRALARRDPPQQRHGHHHNMHIA
jgi:hypothetical protein